MTPFLTIGMATHNDFDGVYFTVQSLRMHHPEIQRQIEILVLDNNPNSPQGRDTYEFCKATNCVRYKSFSNYTSTAVRDMLFTHARGQFVLCLDCHVLLPSFQANPVEEHGALAALLQYLQRRPDSPHLYHGPMLYDSMLPGQGVTHMNPIWSDRMFGVWASDHKKLSTGEPFEIPMHGMGLFCCRRTAWPGFNPLFRGFGGEEGYIHEKIRQRGAKVLCLPFLKWLHRFQRPAGVSYVTSLESRVRNYYIGWNELNLDDTPITEHFAGWMRPEVLVKIREASLLDLKNQTVNGQKPSHLPHRHGYPRQLPNANL
jgi:hypothetical protein